MRHVRAVMAGTAGFALLAAGCEGPADPEGAVASILPAVAHASLPELRLEDLGPVCAATVEACLTTGDYLAAVGADGAVAFVGPGGRAPQLYLVDSATRVPRPLGRGGSGPGEYRILMSLGIGPGGEILAFDGMQRRQLVYDGDGNVRATQDAPVPDGLFDGDFVGGELRFLGTDAPATAGDSMRVRIFSSAPGDARARPIVETAIRIPGYGMGDFRPLPPPFVPRDQFALLPDGGLVHAAGATFVLEALDATGRPTSRFGFDLPPRAVTEEDLRAEAARLQRRLPMAMRQAVEATMRQAATRHPAITRVVALEDGSLWVRESPHAGGDSVSWIVYQDPPLPHGRLVLDADDRVLGAHAGRVVLSRSGPEDGRSGLRWMRVRGSTLARLSTPR